MFCRLFFPQKFDNTGPSVVGYTADLLWHCGWPSIHTRFFFHICKGGAEKNGDRPSQTDNRSYAAEIFLGRRHAKSPPNPKLVDSKSNLKTKSKLDRPKCPITAPAKMNSQVSILVRAKL